MKKPIATLALLCFTILLTAQKSKSGNTLLWRISGNGLQKPSYLFGTMHLTDKSVFYFGDSLYKALEQAEGFAAELDMDRLGMQMINRFMTEEEQKSAREPIKVKDAVSRELWDRYKLPLQEKFAMPAEKITLDDLEEVRSRLQTDLFKKGEMQTFLDAHLFGMARKMGKWVGGLEELQDQEEHMNAEDVEEKIQTALFDDKYYRAGIEWMKKTYLAQQLDSIDAMMYREELSGKKDFIMIKRNVKMARGMDSLSAVRSTFFAVGAAHLPGDSGVIALLQKKGFNVTPVYSSKKINPDKYELKAKEKPWHVVPIKDNAYKLQMPGVAEGYEYYENLGLEMKGFFDISFMKFYLTVNVDMPEERKKLGADSLFKGIKNRYSSGGKISKEKKIEVNGIEGYEYFIEMEDGLMVMQAFIPNLDRLILNAVYTIKEKGLSDEESKKFFQSFTYDNSFKRPVLANKDWSVESFPEHAFSIEMPARPREKKDVVSAEGKTLYEMQHLDIQSQIVYGITHSSVKEGMFESMDTSNFLAIPARMRATFQNLVTHDSAFSNVGGYPAFTMRASGQLQGEQFETSILSISRGSRYYYLYVMYHPNEKNRKSAERFLKSFTLLPYDYTKLQRVSSPDKSFSVLAPAPMKFLETTEDEKLEFRQRLFIYDSLLSATVNFDIVQLPTWLHISSDTAFLRKRSLNYKKESDSIIQYTLHTEGSKKHADFIVLMKGSQLVKRVKFVLNGREFYQAYSLLSKVDLDAGYDKVFKEFKLIQEKVNAREEKTMMAGLQNVLDTGSIATVKEVKLWWDEIDFKKGDVPALQKMAFRLYADYDTSCYDNINTKLFLKLLELDSAHTTVSYIRENFAGIAAKDEYLKPFIIGYLSRIKTKESYTLLQELFNGPTLKTDRELFCISSFYDSLPLTATLFPSIMKHTGTKSLGNLVLGITTWLLDSNKISKNDIKPYVKGFISAAKYVLENEKGNIEENPYSYYDHIKILGTINTAESNALLNKFAKFNDKGIRFNTLIAQLGNGVPVDSKTIFTLASTDEYREDLYDNLEKLGKKNLFPLQFRSQMEFGKSRLYSYTTEDDMEPESIVSLGERIRMYKGKQVKFYLYKVHFESSDYFGVAGPYSLNSKDYSSEHEITGMYWDEEYDAKEINSFFKKYMDSMMDTGVKDDVKIDSVLPPPPPAFLKTRE